MKIPRREQIDAQMEELRTRFRNGEISEAVRDREIARLASERAAPDPGPASGTRPDGVHCWERLESAITAFCQTYLWYQPRGE